MFPLAPCVSTRKSPEDFGGACSIPRTGGWPGVLSMKEVMAALLLELAYPSGAQAPSGYKNIRLLGTTESPALIRNCRKATFSVACEVVP